MSLVHVWKLFYVSYLKFIYVYKFTHFKHCQSRKPIFFLFFNLIFSFKTKHIRFTNIISNLFFKFEISISFRFLENFFIFFFVFHLPKFFFEIKTRVTVKIFFFSEFLLRINLNIWAYYKLIIFKILNYFLCFVLPFRSSFFFPHLPVSLLPPHLPPFLLEMKRGLNVTIFYLNNFEIVFM